MIIFQWIILIPQTSIMMKIFSGAFMKDSNVDEALFHSHIDYILDTPFERDP